MAEFLAYRIVQGKLSFERVPAQLKEEVRAELAVLGRPELAEQGW